MLRKLLVVVMITTSAVQAKSGEMGFESPVANSRFAWDSAVSGHGDSGLDVGTPYEFRITQVAQGTGQVRTAAVSGNVVSDDEWNATCPVPSTYAEPGWFPLISHPTDHPATCKLTNLDDNIEEAHLTIKFFHN